MLAQVCCGPGLANLRTGCPRGHLLLRSIGTSGEDSHTITTTCISLPPPGHTSTRHQINPDTLTDPSRYPLRSGQDGMPGSGSGRKRARAQLDLPSNLKANSSSVYQRGSKFEGRAQ
ncbi:hypothetical protein HBH70_108490 [Parastagonospora nodorum]|nr:hypothetical protein HBH70_108490 [Parastagonospora nodorum]